MLQMGQIRRTLVIRSQFVHAFACNRPQIRMRALEIRIPLLQPLVAGQELRIDRFHAQRSGHQTEIGNRERIAGHIFGARALQVRFEGGQSDVHFAQCMRRALVIVENRCDLLGTKKMSFNLPQNAFNVHQNRITYRIVEDVLIVETHIEKHSMLDERSMLHIRRIKTAIRSVFLAQILHNGDTLAQAEAVVFQQGNLFLRIQLQRKRKYHVAVTSSLFPCVNVVS